MKEDIKITEDHERVLKYLSECKDSPDKTNFQESSEISDSLQMKTTKVEVWLDDLCQKGLVEKGSFTVNYFINPKGGRYLMDKGLI